MVPSLLHTGLLVQLIVGVTAASVNPVAFHSMFSGGAILQRNVNVTVWGTGGSAHGGMLSIQLSDSGEAATATVGADGSWSAILPPHQATAVGTSLTLTATHHSDDGSGVDSGGGATVFSAATVTVSFGETVLCSGQSNMGMPVANTVPCCQIPPATRPHTCKNCFAADNGTAEIAAAGFYTGKIQLASIDNKRVFNGTYCPYPWTNRSCVSFPEWNQVTAGARGTIGASGVSAVCWYTGVALFEKLGGKVPVGLLYGAVGGSPIEFWLPSGHVNSSDVCGVESPPCDNGGKNKYTNSDFYDQLIRPFAPYTVGTMVWDQAERDVHCLPQTSGGPGPENETSRYACMERELVRSWRAAFKSDFNFVGVQLPGYGTVSSTTAGTRREKERGRFTLRDRRALWC